MARALYIHWPFCLKKCPYCDFNSHVRGGVDHDVWERALIADMRHEARIAGGERLTSIFFGGGTPSLMPPELVGKLLAEAENLWGFDPDIEITLEGNPSSVESANYAALAAAGVNRASLGVQSLDDTALRFLGRLHSADEALAALNIAQRHFARVSIDLIYARPGQTMAHWQEELARAVGLGTGHLSLYQLTIEPGTRFATDVRDGAFTPLDDDTASDMFAFTRKAMTANGIPAYEVSNHAKAGEKSRHNLSYWHYDDYVGIGPGAHGRRAQSASVRHRKPENWLGAVAAQGHGIAEETPLSPRQQACEALMMGLRLNEGVDLARLGARLGLPPDALCERDRLAFLETQGLVWSRGTAMGVTAQGMSLLDGVIAELVPDALLA
jgi:putative oxygen-independent coproporphyrinogen III oxidase